MAYMKLIVATLALWLNLTRPALAGAKTLTVTVDDELVLYIDGVEQTNLTNTKKYDIPKIVNLTKSPVLIAVQGTNRGGPGGIVASMSDGIFMTDLSWKCSNILSANWYAINFNDSAWPAAAIGGAHTAISGVSPAAKYIWTVVIDDVVYCRGYPRTLAITADDQIELYIDGVQKTDLQNAGSWDKFDYVDVPMGATVIAVKCTDVHQFHKGLVASILGTGFITDFSWRCADKKNMNSPNWFTKEFIDSNWPFAVQGTFPAEVSTLTGINPKAKVIWTTNQMDYAVVYCRGRLFN